MNCGFIKVKLLFFAFLDSTKTVTNNFIYLKMFSPIIWKKCDNKKSVRFHNNSINVSINSFEFCIDTILQNPESIRICLKHKRWEGAKPI